MRTRCELLFDQTWMLLGEAMRTYEVPDQELDASRLEPRILLSATPIAPMLDIGSAEPAADDPIAVTVISTPPLSQASTEQDARRIELVVIDPRLTDGQKLIDDLSQREQDGIAFEILILDADRDALEQIEDSLRNYGQVDAIHILSHGTDGRLLIGSSLLSSNNIEHHADQLASWQSWLSDDADIMIYGCDVAAGEAGQSLVNQIAALTGADVAASIDATGKSSLGGDWDLEFHLGQFETGSIVNASLAAEWTGLLQAITVTTTLDVVDGDTSSITALLASQGADGFISLREAIIASNQTVGGDVIFLGDGVYTLSIAGSGEAFALTGDLDICDNLEIYGTGAGSTTIDAAGIDRVFSLRNDAQVTMKDITIRGGNAGAGDGGGISVLGKSSLTLQQVVVTANIAVNGAGVYLDSGVLKLLDSTISSNNSSGFGGGIYNDHGDVLLQSAAILHNTAATAGGGIYNEGLGATLSLTNVTVSGNSSTGEGGGIYNKRFASIVHSTIAYNSGSNVGGIFLDSTGTLSIQNSILAVNSGGNANTTLTGSLGNNLSDHVSSGLTHASDIIDASPGLGVLGNHGGLTQTISLDKTSVAVDAGAATGATQIDQRGFLRDISADIGAFEYQRLATTGEVQINSTLSGDQITSGTSVAIDAAGNYVVVWQSDSQDGSGMGVFARRFSSSGTPLSAEIQVNQFTTGVQRSAQVAADASGNFVVTWSSELQDGTASSIYARRFSADGTPIGNEFRVNVTNTGAQDSAVIAMDKSTGSFVVAWKGEGPGDADGIFFRRFSADGTSADIADRLGNSVDRGAEQGPTITPLLSGGFAVAWSQGASVYLQRFDAAGSSDGGEVTIDGLLVTNDMPSLSSDSAGNFVLVYRDSTLLSGGIRGRVFNADGTVRVTEFSVGTGTDAENPSVTMIDDGSLLVTWTENGDSSGKAVKARQFDLDGNPLAAAYRVNITQGGDQLLGSAVALDSDNFLFVWMGETSGDSRGIVARQFGTALATNIDPVAADDSYAVNPNGTLQVHAHLDWYDHDWQYRQLLTASLADASVQLVDYPVLVRLHASAADAVNVDYLQIGTTGQDLRFVDGDGNLLDYKIATWNSGGYSEVWVKVPLLETDHGHNSFFMYYGNAAATDAQQPAAFWDTGFVGVYHLNGSAASATSTGPTGAATGVSYDSGLITQAATFDGSSGRIELGSPAALDNLFAGGATISTWINPSGWGKDNAGRIIDKSQSGGGGGGFVIKVAGTTSSDGAIVFEHDFSGTLGRWRTAPGSISLDTWQQVVVSYDNSNAANVPVIYIDGVQQSLLVVSAPVGTAVSDAARDFVIGNFQVPNKTFDGQIDELRISKSILDEQWIAQDQRSMLTAATTSAAQQSRPLGLLRNDSDADNDSLSISLVTGPSHAAAFTLNADGSFLYQHDGNPAITDSFVYQLSDGQGGVTTATVDIAIINTPPTVTAISDQTISEDTASGAIGFVVGDAESNLNDLVITLTSDNQALVTDASLSSSGTGANRTLSFTPQSNASGTATITVSVSDGFDTTSQSFTVTVQAVNDAPTLSAIADQSINEDTSSSAIAFTVADVDHSAASLIVTASSSNSSLIANGSITFGGTGVNRTIAFTPQADAFGTTVITVTVDDGLLTTNRSFTVTVQGVNDAPIAVADSVNLDAFVTTTIYKSHLLTNDSDVDGDVLSIEIVSGPSFGTLEVLSSGDLRYRQSAHAASGDSFTYRLWDGTTWSDPATVTLNINAATLVVVPDTTPAESEPQDSSDSDSSAETDGPSDSDSPVTEDSSEATTSLNGSIVTVGATMNASVSESPATQELGMSDLGSVFGEAAQGEVAALASDDAITGSQSGLMMRGGSLGTMGGDSRGRSPFSLGSNAYDPTQITLTQPQFWLALDSMKQEVSSSLALTGGITVGAAATTTVGMTVGYVVWVLRSGLLLSSVMAHLPMWRFMDPLTILDSSDSDVDEDTETLVSIADGETTSDADQTQADALPGRPQ